MTVADTRKSSDGERARKRSWIDVLRAAGNPGTSSDELASHPPIIARPARKPAPDMADLLLMNTVDEKAPPATPGSADLLDALVQDHLEHGGEPVPEAIAPPADPAAEPSAEPSISDEQRVKMLQREIDTLLRDSTSAGDKPHEAEGARESGAVIGGSKHATADMDRHEESRPARPIASQSAANAPAPASPVTPEPASDARSAAADTAAVSQEELDLLLARHAKTTGAPAGMSVLGESETEQKLTEAEGVLAEELSSLMAEAEGGPPSEESTGESAPAASETAPTSFAATAGAPEIHPAIIAAPPAGSLVATALAGYPAASPTSTTASGPPDASPAVAGPPGVPAEPVVEPADAAQKASDSGFMWRIDRIANGVMLMLAQLIDLPFGWISAPDKNVIGLVALLLLLGGAALWALSFWIGR